MNAIMLLYQNHKDTHTLITYIQNWKEFNSVTRRLWNYFLLKSLLATIVFVLAVGFLQRII